MAFVWRRRFHASWKSVAAEAVGTDCEGHVTTTATTNISEVEKNEMNDKRVRWFDGWYDAKYEEHYVEDES